MVKTNQTLKNYVMIYTVLANRCVLIFNKISSALSIASQMYMLLMIKTTTTTTI